MNPKKFDAKKLVTSGAIIPAVVITAIAVVVISVIGFIVVKSVRNNGFLPQPTQLITYECKGIGPPFAMRFRHGMDVVELRSDSVAMTGELLNGKIVWSGSPSQVGRIKNYFLAGFTFFTFLTSALTSTLAGAATGETPGAAALTGAAGAAGAAGACANAPTANSPAIRVARTLFISIAF